MFTGIIEELGKVVYIEQEKDNIHFTILSSLAPHLKIDQSVAHNGVCLTVVDVDTEQKQYTVTAISETLQKTNLGHWMLDDVINLERSMKADARLDGHIVQGHVDQIGKCIAHSEDNGSWLYTFEYDATLGNFTVPKGSICINGVSLTVVNSESNSLSVAIIPYTYEHTNFQYFNTGTIVNLEFDVIGKYVKRLTEMYNK